MTKPDEFFPIDTVNVGAYSFNFTDGLMVSWVTDIYGRNPILLWNYDIIEWWLKESWGMPMPQFLDALFKLNGEQELYGAMEVVNGGS